MYHVLLHPDPLPDTVPEQETRRAPRAERSVLLHRSIGAGVAVYDGEVFPGGGGAGGQ